MMDDNDITELAKGMVPFVRDCVAEVVTPLAARINDIEARPTEKGDAGPAGPAGPRGERGDRGEPAPLPDRQLIPPELAGQVAFAVRMLHESPPLEQRSAEPRAPARVTRIERDEEGNFVPVYGETQP